jgi:RHS repeat-associated protein
MNRTMNAIPRRAAALALLLSSLLLPPVSACASGVAALGDIACGVYTNAATDGIIGVTNEWYEFPWSQNPWAMPDSWWIRFGLQDANATAVDDAALTSGQLKWAARCAAEALEEAAWMAGGAGSEIRSMVFSFPLSGNDDAVTASEFFSVVDPIARRVWDLSIDGMFYGLQQQPTSAAQSNGLVSLRELKIAMTFDPFYDQWIGGSSEGNGLPDWWERYYFFGGWSGSGGSIDPDDDPDYDGLPNRLEFERGSDPLDRDTDGDGLVDGIDPDPHWWTWSGDDDHDGVPDVLETLWFGETNVVHSQDSLWWGDFRFGTALAAGICPTNPLPGTTYPSNGLSSLMVLPRFGVETNAGAVVWQCWLSVPRHASWEQFFLSSSPDPREDPDNGAWSLDGFALEWYDEDGSTVSASASPSHAPRFLYVQPEEYGEGVSTFRLALRATGNGLAACPQPIYLVSYTPAVVFTGLPSAVAGDAVLSATAAGGDVAFSVDWSASPGGVVAPGDGSDEAVFETLGADSVSFVRNADGLVSGGTLHGVHAGVYSIPVVAPPKEPPLRTAVAPPAPLRRYLLAVLDPRLTFGTGHGPDAAGLAWDGGSYSPTHDWPLDDYDLWRSFHSDATGGFVCDCTPELDLGLPDEYVPYFETNIVVTTGSGGRETATATAKLSGSTVWTGTADHDPFGNQSCSVLSTEANCGCKTCKRDGTSAGSVRFRLSLGEPREGQVSGFLWFRSDGPVSVTPQLFELLARSDASVSDATASGVRTIVCSDARGRTVVASPIADGVRLAVTNTATGEPDHFWTIVNENGFSNRIRFVRTSRAGSVQSDETYVRSPDGAWSVSDNVAGTAETLVRTDALDDRACPTSSVERVLADSGGLELSHTFVSSRRYGEGANAVLRETERREDVGTPYEKASFATYWETGGKRFGLPRLLSGNDRAWSWTDYDSRGRPVLVFDQREGSACPADGTGWTLSSHPASLRAFATVHSYAPIPNSGDTNNPDDDDTPRTTSRYVVDGASSTLISRTWTVVTHGTTAGRPSVSVRTERAASQSATFGDSANAVSVSVSVDPEAENVPLLLRGRPLSFTDEDGVTTAYEYAFGSWNPATRTFAASSGASHLRTRVFTTTPEAPNGVPLVSTVSETVEDAVHGNEVWSATRVLLANGALSDPFDWEARVYDDQDRLRSTLFADGSVSTNAYSCCRLLFTVGRDGRKTLRSAKTGTDHLYYAMEEVSLAELPHYTNSTPYAGWTAADYRVTQHEMDSLGRERTTTTRIGRSPGQATNAVFSAPGDWTLHEYDYYYYGSSDHSVRTDARYNTSVTERNQSASNVETWRYSSYGIYGTNASSRTETTVSYRGGGSVTLREEGSDWVRTASSSSYGSDGCRTDISVTETSDGECVTNSVSVSDFLGRTARVTTPLSDSTYAYAGASPRVLSVADSVSGLATATLYDALREPVGSVSAGVSSLSSARYELATGAWWRVTESREAAGAQTNLLSTVRERLTGLSDALCAETVSVDGSGVETHAVSSFDPATKVRTETTTSPVASTVVRKSMFGRETERTEDGETVRTFYDPFGRVFAARRSGGAGASAWERLEAVFRRDGCGDLVDEIRPVSASDSAVTVRYYDATGHAYAEYDATGHERLVSRDLSGRVTEESGDAVHPTKQSYDALGRRVSLSTTRNGTAWDMTRWGYDAATGLCTNKTYADGSRVAHTFAADGLPLRTTLASGAWTQNAYDANRRLSSVATSDGEGDVSYLYDAFGRVSRATGSAARYDYARDSIGRATSEVRRTGGFRPTIVSSLSRSYDAYGRPAGYGLAFYGDFRQGVCYTWGMDGKLQGMVCSNAQGRAVEVSFDWDRGRGVGWSVEGLGDCYAYFPQVFERDAWRPWLVDRSSAGQGGFHGGDDRTFQYAFDRLGRPVSRSGDAFGYNARGEVTNAVVDGDAFRYAYDHIGNRQSAYEAGVSTSYSANSVNQYTEVGNDEPEYDDDGNLVDDGTRTFEWSAAGHLTEAATPSARLSCVYDHLGRRVSRTTETRSGFRWNLSDEREYVYDGWNLVHETRTASGVETDIEYFWGPDLSGSLQGAGGVGGLVAVSVDGDFYFPGYDNNGNVIGYWDESGSIVAEYAYDAFGNTIAATGSMSAVFPHRFSTKYYDAETDLYYYGYRYYSPSLGRWISRDPLEEQRNSTNLYEAFGNNTICGIDPLGLCVTVFSIGDSLTYGTDSDYGHFSGYRQFLRVNGMCKEMLRVGKEGNPISKIYNQYTKERTKWNCTSKTAYISLVGMNDALGLARDVNKPNDEIERAYQKRKMTFYFQFASLYYRVKADASRHQKQSKSLFLSVSVPHIQITGSYNKKYMHDGLENRINRFIDEINWISGSMGSSEDPWWHFSSISLTEARHHVDTTPSKSIDDGVHFTEFENRIIAEQISKAINDWSQESRAEVLIPLR